MPEFIATPRPPARLFEIFAAGVMFSYWALPAVLGMPIRSSGHEYLAAVGLDMQHLSIFLGFVGAVRFYVLLYYGKFSGVCPWARAACSFIGILVWAELFMALMSWGRANGVIVSGAPVYLWATICEAITLHRAIMDGREMHTWRRKISEQNGAPRSPIG